MNILGIYLLVGLITHKVVWEVLKRRRVGVTAIENDSPHRHVGVSSYGSLSLALVKAVKMGILIGVVVQTALHIVGTDVLPLTSSPFILRIVGVTIYTVGLMMAILGRAQLDNNWSDIETAQVLPGQAVVARGLYRYIRHPIYLGDLLLLLGIELSLNSWLVVAVGLLAPVVLWKAIREERMLALALPGYDVYCAGTKRFIPFVV